MKPLRYLSLVVFALVLSACVPTAHPKTSETPTPPPTAGCILKEQMVCPCSAPIFVEAWSDSDGNGKRDPQDKPLPGVHFHLTWIEPGQDNCSTPYTESRTLTSDATGHDYYEVGGCGCGTERVEPETPAGYKLTTSTSGECLFDAPESYGNHSMNNLHCFQYGFTPDTP
jgi:hypothetical protein